MNETFVRHHLHGTDPIGRTVNIAQPVPGSPKPGPAQPWVIVGVFHDVHGGMFQPQYEEVDVPFDQNPYPVAAIGVRTAGDPEASRKSISAAVHSIVPSVPLSQIATLDELRDKQLVVERFVVFFYISFAVLALTLAAVGIYGVMAFAVGQREHEIGIRMALGASRDDVVRMVLGESAVLAGIGSLLGLGGAFVVGRAAHSTLYGAATFDMESFLAVAALLLFTAVVASFIPARRAASIEPTQALVRNSSKRTNRTLRLE